MLCVNGYPSAYIDACRSRIHVQLAAYDALIASTADGAAVEAFGTEFFNALVLALEMSFVHRTRGLELKDGNPLNEVRMLAVSLLQFDGVLTADKTIKYRPEKSVLGLAVGDRITLDRASFQRLADAFFTEIDAKFSAEG